MGIPKTPCSPRLSLPSLSSAPPPPTPRPCPWPAAVRSSRLAPPLPPSPLSSRVPPSTPPWTSPPRLPRSPSSITVAAPAPQGVHRRQGRQPGRRDDGQGCLHQGVRVRG